MALAILCSTSPCLAETGCLEETGRWPFGAMTAMSVVWPYMVFGTGTAVAVADLREPWILPRTPFVDLHLPVTDIDLEGGHAFVTTSAGLHVIDYLSGETPVEVGFASIADGALSVAVKGWQAFVMGPSGYGVFHVGDPASPWHMTWGNSWHCHYTAMAFKDPHLYIVGTCGLEVVDISSPATPSVVGSVSVTGKGIALAGDIACVISGYDLHLVDVQEPSNPVALNSTYLWGEATDIAADDPLALITTSGGLKIIDVNDPETPVEIAIWHTDSRPETLMLYRHTAYLAGREFLQVVDVSNPAAPREVESQWVPQARRTAVSGSTALVSGTSLAVIDLNHPLGPTEVGRWMPESPWGIDGVALVDRTAFVTADGGLYSLDLSDAHAPRELSFLDMGEAQQLAVHGNLAHIATYNVGGLCFYSIVDVSDPTTPTRLGEILDWRICPRPLDIAAAGETIIVADTLGLSVIDATDPWRPFEAGRWSRPQATGVALTGRLGLVTWASAPEFTDTGLVVIDLSDRSSPTVLGSWQAPSAAVSVAVLNGDALVSTENDGTFLIDLADSGQPKVIGVVSRPPLQGFDVAASGLRAVTAHGPLGITAISMGRHCVLPRRPSGRIGLQPPS